jgi:hypothetical protein
LAGAVVDTRVSYRLELDGDGMRVLNKGAQFVS